MCGGVARDLATTNQAEGHLAEQVRTLRRERDLLASQAARGLVEIAVLRAALNRALVRHVTALGWPLNYWECQCGAQARTREGVRHLDGCPLREVT